MYAPTYLQTAHQEAAIVNGHILIVFGLVLSLFCAVFPATVFTWKLIGVLVSTVLGLCAGGFVLAWWSGAMNWARPAVYWLLFGGISLTYILGLGWNALVLAGASALFEVFGAFVFNLVIKNGSTRSCVTK